MLKGRGIWFLGRLFWSIALNMMRSYTFREVTAAIVYNLIPRRLFSKNFILTLHYYIEKKLHKSTKQEKMSSFHSHPLGIVALIAHFIQCLSAIIVLGITAWAVRGTKTLTVIFTLVVVSIC